MQKLHVMIAALVAVAAVAAVAVTAVYVREGGERNVADASAAPAGAVAEGESSGSGRIVAFVRHTEPRPVAEVAFATGTGEARTLADWRGKTILVNLWATWCGPCRHEMPSLDRLEARLGGETFEVVAISLDRGGPEKAQAFYKEIGIEHLALYTDGTAKLGTTLGAVGMPTTLLIDAEGRELGRLAGPAEWDSEEAVALITSVAGLPSTIQAD